MACRPPLASSAAFAAPQRKPGRMQPRPVQPAAGCRRSAPRSSRPSPAASELRVHHGTGFSRKECPKHSGRHSSHSNLIPMQFKKPPTSMRMFSTFRTVRAHPLPTSPLSAKKGGIHLAPP
jgi:hypothetical protein